MIVSDQRITRTYALGVLQPSKTPIEVVRAIFREECRRRGRRGVGKDIKVYR